MQAGQLVGGRYRLDAPLGRGGMGQVFRASDERLERPVAVKVADLTQTGNPTLGERFRRESIATARLNHPNIVTIFDAGADERIAWLVMELLAGRSVAQLLREQGRLPQQQAVHIARRVADALVATHAIGVVHRDVKPSNIMVDADRVKLLDFGIAQVSLSADSFLTAPATTLGTAAYMSPEQAQGLRATPASDVYALGGVLVAMLSGEPPYPGGNAIQVANRHLTEPVVSVRARRPEVSEALDDLILRMLAKDPAVRPATAIVARALAHLEDNPDSRATTVLPGPVPGAEPSIPQAVPPMPRPMAPAGPGAPPTPVVPVPETPPSPVVPPMPVAATAVLPQVTRIDPVAAGVTPNATRVQSAAHLGPPATRVQPVSSSPPVAPPRTPAAPPSSARRLPTGPDAGGSSRPPDIRRFQTAAQWLGLLIAALLVFAISWAIGSQVLQAVQATPASGSAAPAREPSAAPTSAPTSRPPASRAPLPLPSVRVPTDAAQAGLSAALAGVDAALSVAGGIGTPGSADAIADLTDRWATESPKIAAGDDSGRRVENFSDRVDAAREKGRLNRVQYEAIKASLDMVRAAL